uniref:Uncharacterized protein n=1 Tax=Oryza sativa subsp. japonica TaxID=39947 RepID=Q6EQ05_ORYSJ|nr:hypothetical protein [Oryza sativa Japonica Group]
MSPRGRVLLPRGAARARWTNDEDGGVRALFVAEARAPAADDEAGGRSINAASVVVVGARAECRSDATAGAKAHAVTFVVRRGGQVAQ